MSKFTAMSGKAAFADPESAPGPLSARTAAALLAAVGDVALVIAPDGEIVDMAVGDGSLGDHGVADWVGRSWIDTVTVESRPKVDEMLAAAARDAAPGRWRQVNHVADAGDLPMRYMVMALNGGGGPRIAIGRDMRDAAAMQQRLLQTQQSLERDYIKLRQAEARYRLLFDLAVEPVLIVDAGTRRIREANPAAYRLLDAAEGSLEGRAVTAIVAADNRDDLIAHLGAAEATDAAPPVIVGLDDRGGEVGISARLFRQAGASLLIVRIDPAGRADGGRADDALTGIVERMPDAFVLIDRSLTILTANTAFLELVELASSERAVGAPLATWLGRPGIDLDLIVEQLREHGAVRNVATIVRGAAGGQEEVEVSAVEAPTEAGDCYGFIIRNVGRRPRAVAVVATGAAPRSVGQLTELVGRMSLKEIVRESTDMIERLCIEAALVYTSDNRASAAEILGVSRQSLYSKLHRHGLGNLTGGDE